VDGAPSFALTHERRCLTASGSAHR
jgi:hypothetical protein